MKMQALQTMATILWSIENLTSGAYLGEWSGETAHDALIKMIEEAGYSGEGLDKEVEEWETNPEIAIYPYDGE